MPVAYYKYFRTRGVYANMQSFQREIRNTMQQSVAPYVMGMLENISGQWVDPPEWAYRIDIIETGIYMHVYPQGTGAQKWEWVSRGVSGHYIRPKSAKVLRFWSYRPYSVPGNPFSGTGVRYGHKKFSKGHWWPGIEGRHFEEWVAETARPIFIKEMEKGLRRAVYAAQREGH